MNNSWEMYCDEGYFHLWAVRNKKDRTFGSPTLFHFHVKSDAEKLKELLEKAV